MAEPALKQQAVAVGADAPLQIDSPGRIFWRRLRKRKPALFGLGLLILLLLLTALAPVLTSFDPIRPMLDNKLAAPFTQSTNGHLMLFGADELGRDVFTRTLLGAQVSMKVGLFATGLSIVIGIGIGAVAGYYGGWIDSALMRFVDIFLSMPSILLLITAVAVYGSAIKHGNELYLIATVLGLLGWPGTARLVRGEFLSLKQYDYVQAARSLGSRDFRIIFQHILPNVLGPIIVSATLGVSGAILSEATLSYLGLGIQAPQPSWGNMIYGGKDYMRNAWWIVTFPGLFASLTTLSLYMLGDGLREALDPRLKK